MNENLRAIADLVLQPISVARKYNASKLRGDLVAGLTVSVVAVPQSMAYALIAGVPAHYGLYTVMVQSLIGALFTSNRYLSVGPINTQSLLVSSAITRIAGGSDPATYLALVFCLTLVKGLLQIGFALAKLGNIVRYVSQSVVIGFTGGAGVLIIAGQVPAFLGIDASAGGSIWPGILGRIDQLARHVHQTDVTTLVIGLLVLAIVAGTRLISRLIPGPLIGVVVGAVVVWFLDRTGEMVAVIGPIPGELPSFKLPPIDFHTVELLLTGAVALAIMGLMEAYSIGKTLAARTGQRIGANRELLSQGLTNCISSFFQCIPGSGSFSRSALNYYAGAQTLYAGVFNAGFVLLIYVFLSPQARFIPLSALAAVLFVIAYSIIDWRYFRRIWRSSREDGITCLITFIATLIVPLQYAIHVGVLLNISIYLRRAGRLHITELTRMSGGVFQERPMVTSADNSEPIRVLQLEGDLFFGIADELYDRLMEVVKSPVQVVILRLKRTHALDASVLGVLETVVKRMRERNQHLVLCGVREELLEEFSAYGLTQLIGPANIFETSRGVFASAKRAMSRASELVGQRVDVNEYVDPEDDAGETWSYQI